MTRYTWGASASQARNLRLDALTEARTAIHRRIMEHSVGHPEEAGLEVAHRIIRDLIDVESGLAEAMAVPVGDSLVSDCTHPTIRRGVLPGTGVCLTCGVSFYRGEPEK